MSFEAQRLQALGILAKTDIWRSNYEPPALRLAWGLGLKVPPPHFARFWSAFAVLGAWFGLTYGLLMWLFVWSRQGMRPLIAIIVAVIAGALFGLFMATYYAYGRNKYKLPEWRSLAEQQRT
jgi:hypothetical protein